MGILSKAGTDAEAKDFLKDHTYLQSSIIKLEYEDGDEFRIIKGFPKYITMGNPFWNCQITTMGNAGAILSTLTDSKDMQKLLRACLQGPYLKRMLMIDIYQSYVEEVINNISPFIFKEADGKIKMNSPYISSNGSKMCILLFCMDIDKIFDNNNE